MNPRTPITVRSATRSRPELRPLGWLMLAAAVWLLASPAQAGEHDHEFAQAQAEIAERRAELAERKAEIESRHSESVAREIKMAERALEHAEKELQLAAERLAELSLKHEANAPRAFAYRLLGGRKRAMLGVTVRTADDESGVHINGVTPGGPAEKAGLHAGDIIVAANGEAFEGKKALKALSGFMESLTPGDEVQLTILRGGQRKTIAVTTDDMSWPSAAIAAAPPAPPAPGVHVYSTDADTHCSGALTMDLQDLGEGRRVIRIDPPAPPRPPVAPDAEVATLGGALTLAQLNKDLGSYFGTPTGVLVVAADQTGLLGLEAGDVIRSVNGQHVQRPHDVIEALQQGKPGAPIKLAVTRRGAHRQLASARPDALLDRIHVESYASRSD